MSSNHANEEQVSFTEVQQLVCMILYTQKNNDQGTCGHPGADNKIIFEDGCVIIVCDECEESNYSNCPEHPENYRELPSYQND